METKKYILKITHIWVNGAWEVTSHNTSDYTNINHLGTNPVDGFVFTAYLNQEQCIVKGYYKEVKPKDIKKRKPLF